MLLAAAGTCCSACRRSQGPAAVPNVPPTLRVHVLATLAGALEPCGCTKDQLGGVDHAAALVRGTPGGPPALLVGAGPLFFMNPTLQGDARQQDVWKAEAIGAALGEMKLTAWAAGYNDWAAGSAKLAELARASGATLLGANLTGDHAGATATRVVEAGGVKVGLAGVAAPLLQGAPPAGVQVAPAAGALKTALATLEAQGTQVQIALTALPRGEALRLAEEVPGFELLVVGKPFDRGEGNDAPTPPVLVGKTLVVEPPNHLQAVAVVDLYVRDGSYVFQDAAGVGAADARTSAERRVEELERKIAQWEKAGSGVSDADLAARRADLVRARAELERLTRPQEPASGSYFRYDLGRVNDAAGTDPGVKTRMGEYYSRVNDHNREAFKDRKPPEPGPSESAYLGIAACSGCHAEERAFWDKTGHAHAYSTLSAQHKEFNLDCVSCHVTGYERPGGSTVTFVEKLRDVQCEVCHGPGSRHPGDPSNDALLVKHPSKDLCAASCHHPPHVGPTWSVDEAWPHILGPGHGG